MVFHSQLTHPKELRGEKNLPGEPGIPEVIRITRLGDPYPRLSQILGTPYELYRTAFQKAQAGALPPLPLHVDVDITTRCNLACPMCPAGHKTQSLFPGMGVDLDGNLLELFLNETLDLKIPSLRLGVTGEPLLRVETLDSLKLLGKKILDLSLITNGQKLTPDVSLKLVRQKLTQLMVSVDAGCQETYRKVRPGGDFDLLVHNLKEFLQIRKSEKSPLPLLRLSYVEISSDPTDKALFLKKFGPLADYLVFQKYVPLMAKKTSPGQGHLETGRCTEPFTRLALYANGSLFPCCSDFGRLAPVGVFPEISIQEAWENESAQLTRLTFPDNLQNPACRECATSLV
ncbi:MAG: radical SAM protein [Deltaproteobacteria bacterium]|jgi:MoaA/NifB/PqqE/SkfB family radical SAM enzyme|nr:radical SAM protein [Deltaproteobacteria bacterium]